jgi:hypothetical protein
MMHTALSADSANHPKLFVTGGGAPVTTRQQNPMQFIVIYTPEKKRLSNQARPMTEKLLMNGPAMRGSLIMAP